MSMTKEQLENLAGKIYGASFIAAENGDSVLSKMLLEIVGDINNSISNG